MNRLLYGICVMFVAVGIGGALTVRGQSATRAINHKDGVAVQGYDVVAYFTRPRGGEGQSAFIYEWNGVRWQFAKAQNRDAFAKEPASTRRPSAATAPTASAAATRWTSTPRPSAIDDGTLYLNYSKSVQRTWNQDRAGYIDKARQQWPKVMADLK